MSYLLARADARSIPLADGSVHCVVTSPPYFALRDYGVAGQIGLEATPRAYIETMLEVFAEVHRVMRDDATLWVNIGDSYNAHPGQRKTTDKVGAKQETNAGSNSVGSRHVASLKPKDLIGIPWMLAFALRDELGFYLRSDVIWSKPNPMPESVTDRPTKAHEYLFLLAKSEAYFYDAEAIKDKCVSGPSDMRKMEESRPRIGGKYKYLVDPLSKASSATNIGKKRSVGNPSGRNARTVWDIATQPFPGAHFATFPRRLVNPCIQAGTSERGCCPACGAPWERLTETSYDNPGNRSTNGPRSTERKHQDYGTAGFAQRLEKRTTTLGWQPTCSCNVGPPVPCVVLDPFIGSGTTCVVAESLGRRSIGLDLSPEYLPMAKRRIDRPHAPAQRRHPDPETERHPLFPRGG